MKLKTFLYAIIAIFLSAFTSFTLPIYISGHLKNNGKADSITVAYLIVFVKGDDKVLAKSVSDANGNFQMNFTPKKEKSFDFYCYGAGVDTLLIKSLTNFDSDEPTITFSIPGQQKRNSRGQVICPKCNNASKVYKIRYSDAPVSVRQVDKRGNITYSASYTGFYQAGSDVVGAATYYCDRDKVKF